jgi:hypothetical protein
MGKLQDSFPLDHWQPVAVIVDMRKYAFLLLVAAILFVVPLVIFDDVYGPSYDFLSGEDCWVADGNGGWVKHGNPADPPPRDFSVKVLLYLRCIPIAMPILLLIGFLLVRAFRARPPRSAKL